MLAITFWQQVILLTQDVYLWHCHPIYQVRDGPASNQAESDHSPLD